MFSRILHKVLFPLKLSEALAIVMSMTAADTKTAGWYRIPVESFIAFVGEDIAIRDVTGQQVTDWYKNLDKVRSKRNPGKLLSPWTKDSYGRALRAYFGHLVEMRHLDAPGPAANLKLKRLPRKSPKDLSEDEVQLLFQAAKDNARDYALLRVLHSTGCRIGELVTMFCDSLDIRKIEVEQEPELKEVMALLKELGQLDLVKEEKLYRYRGRVLITGKGHEGHKKTRYVFLNNETCRAVVAYMESRPPTAPDNLWLNERGGAITESGIYARFKAIAGLAGVDASPHKMRHTFANNLRRKGADVLTVSELLGHSDPMTTARQYWSVTEKELQEAHEKFLDD